MNILQSYIDYLLSYDLSLVESHYERVSLRLGTVFLDRVRLGYESNLEYDSNTLVSLVDQVEFKPLDEVSDPIKYLCEIINEITDKDHPICRLMFFGGGDIDTNVYSKFTYYD